MHTQKHLNYINGKWAEPSTGEYYKNYNPADENQVLGEFPLSGEKDADAAVAAAQAAFESWSTLLPNERVRYFQKLTDLLVENRDRIGEAICLEEGKTWKEAISEPTRGAIEVSFFTGEGQRMEGITMPSTRKGVTSLAMRVPLGVVAAIAPWNFPFLTPLRKVIPALVMGNTVVFKPASDTPMSAVLLAEMFEKAGFPQGVFNMVIGRGTEIGDAICANPLVRGITFTGSTVVGRHINEVAAHHFAKVQLEMGGKNPAIVADYKDLPAAARQLSNAAFALAGQRCTAISRIIVTEDIADQLENLIAAEMSKLIVGPGTDSKTNVCPIINRSAGKKIMQFIEGARADGATIMVGGKQLKGGDYDKGMYIEPTLITNVTPNMDVARKEIFGPVLSVLRVKDFAEAMRIANDTNYGLAASLFSDNLSYIHTFLQNIQAGMAHVNHGTVTDDCMPFGGVKESGLGSFSKGKTNMDFFTTYRVTYVKWM